MGRTPSPTTGEGKSSVHVNVVFPIGDYRELAAIAEEMGISISSFVRKAVKERLLLDGRYYTKIGGKLLKVGGIG